MNAIRGMAPCLVLLVGCAESPPPRRYHDPIAPADGGTDTGPLVGDGGPARADGSTDAGDAGGDAALDADAAVPDTGPRSDTPTTARCMPGHYAGTYTGSVTAGGMTFPTSGVVDLTLLPLGLGEFLEIGDGTISGTADGRYPYEGAIEGQLDCATSRLDARIVAAHVDVLFLRYDFEGTLAADHVPHEYRFESGVWDVWQTAGGPPTDGTGSGTWTAALVP